jgi:hypothetical protein
MYSLPGQTQHQHQREPSCQSAIACLSRSDVSQGRVARAVLGGAGHGNQSGIDHRASFKHQAFGSYGGVDGSQQLDAQVVLFE